MILYVGEFPIKRDDYSLLWVQRKELNRNYAILSEIAFSSFMHRAIGHVDSQDPRFTYINNYKQKFQDGGLLS